jgi:hypothetical protein
MEPTQQAALERLAEAIKDRSLQGYTEVTAGDVLAVAGTVPEAKQTPAIQALVVGARNNPANLRIHQKTDALAELVSAAKG